MSELIDLLFICLVELFVEGYVWVLFLEFTRLDMQNLS